MWLLGVAALSWTIGIPLSPPETLAAELPDELKGLDLTATQELQIVAIVVETDRRIQDAKIAIARSRAEIHRKAGTPYAAPTDIAKWTHRRIRFLRDEQRNRIGAVLTEAQRRDAAAAFAKLIQRIELPDFTRFEARQKTSVWCWAAAIQMVFNYSGIEWDQERVVEEIKGRLVQEAATPSEIVNGVKGWRVKHKYFGKDWVADAQHKPGAPPPERLIVALDFSRIILIGIDSTHLLVLFRVSYRGGAPQRGEVVTVGLYDPLDGKEREEAWNTLSPRITDWWSTGAELEASKTF